MQIARHSKIMVSSPEDVLGFASSSPRKRGPRATYCDCCRWIPACAGIRRDEIPLRPTACAHAQVTTFGLRFTQVFSSGLK